MMKLFKLPILFFSVFIFLSISVPGVLAHDDWRDEREQGIRLEMAKNFATALVHFKKALAAVPTDSKAETINFRVQLQCQIATCYLRQEQRLKALPYIDSLLVSAAALRASDSIKADTEMYLVALVEECDSNHSNVAKASWKTWQEYNMLSQKICEMALPAMLTPNRYSSRARCFLAAGDRPGALKFLSAYMTKLSPSDPHYLDMQLKQAALKNFLNQPDMLRDLSLRLAKSKLAAEVACLVGQAQTWATDYVAADKTLASAYDKLEKQKKLSKVDRINLLNTRLDNSLDCGRWTEAEALARQCLALSPPERIRNLCLTALSVSLARQGKAKEAVSINEQKRKSNYSFLEDEERDATAETVKRRAGLK
jgi:tetratricopeptide (TPR) repeat protein